MIELFRSQNRGLVYDTQDQLRALLPHLAIVIDVEDHHNKDWTSQWTEYVVYLEVVGVKSTT